MAVNMQNSEKGLCVVCNKFMGIPGFWQCTKCRQPCETTETIPISQTHNFIMVDIKSKCCGADVDNIRNITCGQACHNKLVEHIEKEFGKFKQVTDQQSGKSYKVPTRYIIEHGLNITELLSFPEWDEK